MSDENLLMDNIIVENIKNQILHNPSALILRHHLPVNFLSSN